MKSVYEIKFLSNEDFDRLPKKETNGADISDSLGFYNPFTNRVFIRHTSIPELDKYLLDHEFEHLIEQDATDEDEFGIRHKKGKKFFKEIFVPMVTLGALSLGDQGAFVNLGAKGNKINPLGSIGSLAGYDPTQEENRVKKEQSKYSQFGGLGFNMPEMIGSVIGNSNTPSAPSFSSSASPFTEQQSGQSGLNQGLNQESINPLSNPYSRYGQQVGRLYF